MNSPSEQPTPITKLPDGSGCFTATVMSREEAMALPVNERPLCFRISSEIYHAVFEAIGAASMCWNPSPSGEVFNSTEAEKVAVDLCFKIAKDQERELSRLRAALRSIRQIVETPSEVPQLSLFEIDQVAEQALSLTPDQSLLESMHKEIEGLKGNLSDMATSFNKLNTAFGAQTKIWENTIKERDSLRSQLEEAQSNYQTLLDAVNHEIELRKAAEDQLEEAQEKLKATGIEAEVCGDITNRQQLGIAKYGQTVADNPAELGEWLQHAYEETLDTAVYLRRALQAIRSARLNIP